MYKITQFSPKISFFGNIKKEYQLQIEDYVNDTSSMNGWRLVNMTWASSTFLFVWETQTTKVQK